MSDAKYERFPFLKELDGIFAIMNRELFSDSLKLPIHTVLPDRKYIFRFMSESNSIVVGAKFSNANIYDILQAYLHELVHISNHQQGIIDFTANQYHNKKFLAAANAVGFYVGKHKSQGWSVTKFKPAKKKKYKAPTKEDQDRLTHCLSLLNFDETIFQEGREEVERIVTSSVPARVCFLKYVCKCPPPHNSIRSGRRPDGAHPLKIQCLICGSPFICGESSGKT